MVSYSEAIPNGKLFRSQSEWKGRSEWMALPNGKLCHVFTLPRESKGAKGRKGTQREGGPLGTQGGPKRRGWASGALGGVLLQHIDNHIWGVLFNPLNVILIPFYVILALNDPLNDKRPF